MLTDANIESVSQAVATACKADFDSSVIKRIKASIKDVDTAIENLWIAIEKGQSVEMITERIEKRKSEKAALEAQLAIEKKKQVVLTAPQIKHFLYSLKNGDMNNPNSRRGFINIFVGAIFLYDKKMTVVLNGSGEKTEITDIFIDEMEEYFDSAISDKAGSTVVASVPPYCRNPNSMPKGNEFGFFASDN